jgi:hypothetical protein
MDEYLQPTSVGPEHFYSANRSFPLGKALEVNGYEELLDGEQGNDDTVFSYALAKAGVRFIYDPTLEVRFDPHVHTLTQLSPDPRKRNWGKEPWATTPKTRIMDDGTPHYANEWLAHEIMANNVAVPTGNKFDLEDLRRLPKELAGDIDAVQEQLTKYVDPDLFDWRDGERLSDMVGGEFAYARDADTPLTTDPARHASISKDNHQVALIVGKVLQRRTLTVGKFEQIEVDVRPAGVLVTPLTKRLLMPLSRAVRIYGTDLGESVDVKGNSDEVQAVDCSADERYFAAGGWDAAVHVWELATYKRVCSFEDLEDSVTALAFVPNSYRLVGGTASGRAYLWDVDARKQLWTASVSMRPFSFIAPFTCESKPWTLCGFSDGRVAMINLESSDSIELGSDVRIGQDAAHDSEVTSGHVDDRGRYGITASSSGDMIVWDLSRRSIVQRISIASSPLAVKLSVAERTVLVVTSGGQLATWRINPQFAGLLE